VDNTHPIDLLCKEYDLTRYRLSKLSGVSENTLSNIVRRNTTIGRISVDVMHALSVGLNIDMTELYHKLKSFEKSNTDTE